MPWFRFPRALVVLIASIPMMTGTDVHAQDSAIPATPAPSASAVPASSPLDTPSKTYGPAPTENRYDVLSKMISPMAGALLGGGQSSSRALLLRASVGQVAGRLPSAIQGATFSARIEYPGRIRLEAPLLGETVTVCRNGNQVWAIPGSKIEFLLGQFRHKPRPNTKGNTPLALPFTPQQAVLLPALFQLEREAATAEIGGASCRVISGGLMPEVAKAAKAEDFSAKLWICSDYTPRRIDIHRSDFAMSFLIEEMSYSPAFPASTWQPPEGVTDIFRCDENRLEELLYVVMNSLQMSAEDKPWLNEAPAGGMEPGPIAPQSAMPLGPVR